MFKNNNKQAGGNSHRFNGRQPSRRPAAPETPKSIDLFPIAVFIMGIVSCYTTATGLMPMLDNWVLSYATAIALSVFMVAIALRIPKAYQEGNQTKLILGYIFVASFSVLLNFNAIYGVFTSEKLLYEELKENKSQLTSVSVSARAALDQYFDTRDIEEQLSEAKALLKEETTNRMDPGYGSKARRLNKEVVIPLTAKMEAIKSRYDPAIHLIDSLTGTTQAEIDQALASGNIKSYRQAVDKSIDAHAQIGEMTTRMVGEENFEYEPLTFQHRDVGNLNHSLWTLTNIAQLDSKQASSVIVSLLLSLLIDFIVLFVIVMINRPPKEEKEEEDEEKGSKEGRKTFAKSQSSSSKEREESEGIYALRKERKAKDNSPRPYKDAVVKEEKAEKEATPRQESSEKSKILDPSEDKPKTEDVPAPPVWIPLKDEDLSEDKGQKQHRIYDTFQEEEEEESDPESPDTSFDLEVKERKSETNGFSHKESGLIPYEEKF